MKLDIIDTLNSLCKAQGVISPYIGSHQQQVAYLSYRIAEQLDLPQERKAYVLVAGLLHDIGALSLREKAFIITESQPDIDTHAFRGAYLIAKFPPLEKIAPMIKYHHYPWDDGKALQNNADMPIESQLLHLADRICANITEETFILSQVTALKEFAKKHSGRVFVPEQVNAFLALADNESIWLDLITDDPTTRMDYSFTAVIDVTIDELIALARIYSQLIDFRSPFTATHSASVANVAQELAKLMHFSANDCKKMLIAGYLHDLGKLTIDNDILEKQSALNEQEFAAIRSHTYYTYHLLDDIAAFQKIKCWAAYHHEKLDGTGYPFHLKGDDLSLGARIMAVADVFSALSEKRPYKDALSEEKISSILLQMVDRNALDTTVVATLLRNFPLLSEICETCGAEAAQEYHALYQINTSRDCDLA